MNGNFFFEVWTITYITSIYIATDEKGRVPIRIVRRKLLCRIRAFGEAWGKKGHKTASLFVKVTWRCFT
jgi:hypothetical protein